MSQLSTAKQAALKRANEARAEKRMRALEYSQEQPKVLPQAAAPVRKVGRPRKYPARLMQLVPAQPIIPAAPPAPPFRQNQYGPSSPISTKLRQAIFNLRERRVAAPSYEKVDQDSFRGQFKRETYTLNNVGSLEGIYNSFKKIRGYRKDKSAIVRFINAAHDDPRYITIQPADLFSLDDFISKVESISKGESFKSDAVGEGNFIDPSYLGTISFDIYGEGKISKPFFVIDDDVVDEKSLCLWRAVFSQIEYDETRPIDKNITSVKDFDTQLRLLYNKTILCYGDWTDDAKNANYKYCKHVFGEKNAKYRIKNNPNIALAEIDPSELSVIYDEPGADMERIKIVYYDEHFIQFRGVKPGKYYFDHTKRLLRMVDGIVVEEKRRQLQTSRLVKDGLISCPHFKTEIICFDVETRYDEKYVGLIKPYSISWTFGGKGYFYMGDDCVERMIKFLMKNQSNKLFCLLGYNSSRFDNIFLLPALLKMDMLTSVFYQNNSILNIKWGGRHTVHDICRFTMSSLERACAEFKTIFRKVGGFSHESVQSHYNKYKNINEYFHAPDCEVGIKENRCNGLIYEIRYMPTEDEAGTHLIELTRETDERNLLQKAIDDKMVAVADIEKTLKAIADYNNRIKDLELIYPRIGNTLYLKPDVVTKSISDSCRCKCEKYNKLITYNLFDVFSTEELYLGIEQVMLDNKAIDTRLFDSKTIGSIIYKLFARDTNKRLKLPLLAIQNYKRVRSGLFAGRTQCYKGVSFDLSRKTKYVMLDVKSLYPYVMLNRYFPVGEIIYISYSACMSKDLIGFYNCKVNQSALNKNVLPLRAADAPLNWTYRDDMTVFINTVDIKCLLDAGATVEILKTDGGVDDGFAFSDKIRGDDLFNCLVKWKKIKEEQDIYKSTSDPKYNVVLRNMAKTFLNALSGKVIENIHLDTTALVRNKADMEEVIKSSATIGDIQLSAILTKTSDGGGVGLISYKRKEEDEFKRQNRPIYLGTLIYAYARDHMYRSVLANYDVIYQDTDSALLSFSEYERFKLEQPNLLGDDFGKFALEDFSELFDSYITLSPKNYFIMGEKDGKYTVIKKGFKGVNLTRDKYIHNPADYCWHITQTHKKNGKVIYDIATNKGFDLYYGNIDYSLINEERAMFEQPLIVAPKTVYNDWQRFIDNILEHKHAYVLTSSLNKTLRNVGTSGAQAGGIYQRFLLKKININLEQATLPFEAPENERLLKIYKGRHEYKAEAVKLEKIRRPHARDCEEDIKDYPEYTTEQLIDIVDKYRDSLWSENVPLGEYKDGKINFTKENKSIILKCLKLSNVVGGGEERWRERKTLLEAMYMMTKEFEAEMEKYIDYEIAMNESAKDNIKKIEFSDKSIVKFADKNILRCDLGNGLDGYSGNRAFNFDTYNEYLRSKVVNRLMKAAGDNFHLNEYPYETKIDTRLWLDIDMAVPREKVNAIAEFINSVTSGGDNKILQSGNGKLHIVINVNPYQPIQMCKMVKRGRKQTFVPTGEITFDTTAKGKFALMLFFKKKLREIMANETYDTEWNKAFDMKAPGMRCAFAIKMKAGKCESRAHYRPIGMENAALTVDQKCATILDCSIYKPVTGSIKSEFYSEIEKLAFEYDKKIETQKKKLMKRYERYSYDVPTKSLNCDGVKYKITQKFVDDLVAKIPKQLADGVKWKSIIRNVANISIVIPKFNNDFALHVWSSESKEYNKERNNEIWGVLVKKAVAENVASSIYWLMYNASH